MRALLALLSAAALTRPSAAPPPLPLRCSAPHTFTASSTDPPCACDDNNAPTCSAVPGIEPVMELIDMLEPTSVGCLMYGPDHGKACGYFDTNNNDPAPFVDYHVNGTASQPAGRRVVYVDIVDEMEWRNLYTAADHPPLWIDGAAATLAQRPPPHTTTTTTRPHSRPRPRQRQRLPPLPWVGHEQLRVEDQLVEFAAGGVV
eukprot:COSAG04_NODE_963_length_9150_cov_8.566788_1_plen_201_part_10